MAVLQGVGGLLGIAAAGYGTRGLGRMIAADATMNPWNYRLVGNGSTLGMTSGVGLRYRERGMHVVSPRQAGVSYTNEHHIATPYGDVGKELEKLFDNAGLSNQGWYNKITIPGHQGPHGFYNSYVLEELQRSVRGMAPGSRQYSQSLFTGLVGLRKRLNDPSDLQLLVTTSITYLERRLTR